MDVFKSFASDETKENDGVWCELGAGASLLVARAGNRKYARMLSSQVEKNQRALDLKNEAADDLSDQIMISVLANTVLLGWKGIQFKREDMAYSVENAKTLLSVKDFRSLVSKLSNDFEAYKAVQEAQVLGN